MIRIAVVIPVGPEDHHADYLGDALASVGAQTRSPDLILFVDDMHGLVWGGRLDCPRALMASSLAGQQVGHVTALGEGLYTGQEGGLALIWRAPWRLGVGSAFNAGCAIALAQQCDLALMLGADDKLEPRALEHLESVYEANGRADGYYWLDTIYEDGTVQTLPCNNAAVTPGFMRETGGLPIEASSGGMDAALISAMMVHRPDYLIHVRGNEGRFWSRQHAGQESARLGAYHGTMDAIRGVFTDNWKPTQWGRYS